MNENKNNKLLYDKEEVNRKKIENIYRSQNPYEDEEDNVDEETSENITEENDEIEDENLEKTEEKVNNENLAASNKIVKAANTIQKGKDMVNKAKKLKDASKIGAFLVANWPIVLVLVLILLVLIIIVVISDSSTVGNGSSSGNKLGIYGYDYLDLDGVCEEITVLDENGGLIGTYDLETYVAGVITGEVSSMNDMTTYEVLAIAARTYGLRNAMVDNCTMISSPTRQVFTEPTNEKIIEAANNTRGLVITRNGKLESGMYDSFCWDEKDDKYYYMCQGDYDTGEPLKIPISWAEEAVMKYTGNINFLNIPRYSSHGQGVSQHGTFYLSASEGWDRDEILYYFFGSDSLIMSIYEAAVAGEYPIDPNADLYKGLKFIANGTNINDVLAENGTNLDEYNEYLRSIVEKYGEGRRETLINFAVAAIGSLAEMGYKMNYQWGGQYWNRGLPSNLGDSAYTNCTHYASQGNDYNHCITNYVWTGFDCVGFVNWVIVNAFGSKYTGAFSQTATIANTVDLSSDYAVCEPGDFLVSNAHITIVVAIDEENKQYIIAHSTGSDLANGTGGAEISTRPFLPVGYKSEYKCRHVTFYVDE